MMNPFFDIIKSKELPKDSLQLVDLGEQRVWGSTGKRIRGDWGGTEGYETNHIYTAVTAEDYDSQFVSKLLRIRPSYEIEHFVDHHFAYYLRKFPENRDVFLKHMRYAIYPALKKRDKEGVYTELFEEWLKDKSKSHHHREVPSTVNNNTINFGNVHAPIQFQQNSPNAIQTQNNQIEKEKFKEFIDLLRRDIEVLDEKIREDFGMEMDYAVKQLNKGNDPRPQLVSIGGLMKEVGLNTFSNVLAAPIFDFIKPFLGLT